MNTKIRGLVMGLLVIGAVAARAEVTLTFDHFYDHAALTRALKSLAEAYPQLVTLESAGKSHQGRELWAVTLNNPKTGPPERKPGFYIDGNIHGNEVQGGEVALYAIYYLLTHYGKSPEITRLMDRVVFYVIPTMNPDSRDYFISQAVNPNYPRSSLVPYDDDRDGLCDEDGPEDLDGDGSITMMRKKDPDGRYKAHPDDPRIMVPVRDGEKGEYSMLGIEGIDNDGDGEINEDGPGGYDMNRNYGYNWMPNYIQRGAGDYPFCWPETQAVRDFLLKHPNIAGSQNFHNNGGYILRGPGADNLGDFPGQDVRVYDYIGKRGEKILPGYKYLTIWSGLYTVYGGSVDFIHATLGAYAFTNELDTDFKPGDAPPLPPGDENAAYYNTLLGELNQEFYYDKVLMNEYTADWKPYKHPLFGEIEIGGTKKFGRRVPPPFKLPETCHRNVMFCLFHAGQLPELAIEPPKVTRLDGGLWRIDLAVSNAHVAPSISASAIQQKLHRPDRVLVKGDEVKLLTAGELTDKYREQTRRIKCRDNSFLVTGGIPGFGKEDFRLLVKGQGEATIVYDSLKAGWHECKVKLGN